MTLPPIVIVLLTYQRTNYAAQTVLHAILNLKYQPGLMWYVADDGSDSSHVNTVHGLLEQAEQEVIGHHSEKLGYGAGANKAWQMAHEHTPLTLWLEDDWVLNHELRLEPYAKLLMESDQVGMIRLGHLNQYMVGTALGYDGEMYWRLDREPADGASPVFTGHPSLRHKRYWDVYGPYPEGHNPGDTELAYAYKFRIALKGPNILYPARAGQWGFFGHIGEVKSYE